MGGNRARIDPPDPEKFPTPQWATWCDNRTPNFKVHGTLGQAKSAVTTAVMNNYKNDPVAYANAFVYEFIDGKWTLAHAVHPGDSKSIHPLWNQYMIPEYEDLADTQKKLLRRK